MERSHKSGDVVPFEQCRPSSNNDVWKRLLVDLLPTPPESPTGEISLVAEHQATENIVEGGTRYDKGLPRISCESEMEPQTDWESFELLSHQHIRSQLVKCSRDTILGTELQPIEGMVNTSKCPLVKDCMWSEAVVIPADVIFSELSKRMRSCRPRNLPARCNDFFEASPEVLTQNGWTPVISNDSGFPQGGSTMASCGKTASDEKDCTTGDKSEDDCVMIASDDEIINVEIHDDTHQRNIVYEKNKQYESYIAAKRQQVRLVEHLDEIHSYCYKARKQNDRHKRQRNESQEARSFCHNSFICNKTASSSSAEFGDSDNVNSVQINGSQNERMNGSENEQNNDSSELRFESFNNVKHQNVNNKVISKRKSSSNRTSIDRFTGRQDGHRYRRQQHNVLERNRRHGLRTQFSTLHALLSEYDRKVRRFSHATESSSARMARVQMLDRAGEVVRELEYADRRLQEGLSRLGASNRSLKVQLEVKLQSWRK